MKKYSIDDLIGMAKLGRFGNADMNNVAMQAFVYLKQLQQKNIELEKTISDLQGNKDIKFFSVNTEEK